MKKFIIKKNNFLSRDVFGFYHTYYLGFNKPCNLDYLNILKNDFNKQLPGLLNKAYQEVERILEQDLPKIPKELGIERMTVCVVPRAKEQRKYHSNQLLFKQAVKNVVTKFKNIFEDGTDYILRIKDTFTTHLGNIKGNYGPEPYPGITIDTCNISKNVKGKDILLVDDIYTLGVNVDEDAIEALFENGANSVTFYAVAYTLKNYTQNALNILALLEYQGIGRGFIVENIQKIKEMEENIDDLVDWVSSIIKKKISINDFKQKRESIKKELQKCADNDIYTVAIGDEAYSGLVEPRISRINKINNNEKPIVLFLKGDLNLLLDENNLNVAVIGTRYPNEEDELLEKEIIWYLLRRSKKVTILSGLAIGCDTIAHKSAIKYGGKTIAILPSPILNILPKKNEKLAKKIFDKCGLLISEYYKDPISKQELKRRYVECDRLQALFSDCIILIASHDIKYKQILKGQKNVDFGSRHAMRYAKKFGILRAVVYDHQKHSNDLRYSLNKKLANEKYVIAINESNKVEVIKKILEKIEKRYDFNDIWGKRGL
ncbi:MAG: DNA-processing protein DprA [candidate division WOR-3 bacterium]